MLIEQRNLPQRRCTDSIIVLAITTIKTIQSPTSKAFCGARCGRVSSLTRFHLARAIPRWLKIPKVHKDTTGSLRQPHVSLIESAPEYSGIGHTARKAIVLRWNNRYHAGHARRTSRKKRQTLRSSGRWLHLQGRRAAKSRTKKQVLAFQGLAHRKKTCSSN